MTQVSVKRLFSSMKLIFSDLRGNLFPELLNATLIIRCNGLFKKSPRTKKTRKTSRKPNNSQDWILLWYNFTVFFYCTYYYSVIVSENFKVSPTNYLFINFEVAFINCWQYNHSFTKDISQYNILIIYQNKYESILKYWNIYNTICLILILWST